MLKYCKTVTLEILEPFEMTGRVSTFDDRKNAEGLFKDILEWAKRLSENYW